jgi:hypothetical protein
VTDDAIRDGAITREVGEEPFLEQNRQWAVDIDGERLPPEGLEDLRSFERGGKERRKKTEAFFDLRLDLFGFFAHWREPRVGATRLLSGVQSRFHNLNLYRLFRRALLAMDSRQIRLCNIAKFWG